MPAVDPGYSQPKKKVKRPKPKPTTVAPADRTQERAVARQQQIKRSVSKSPDRQDTKRAPAQQKRDAAVVAENVKVSRKKAEKKQRSARIDAQIRRKMAHPQTSSTVAPVLKVLDQTTRPLHAIAAASKESIRGGGIGTIGGSTNATSVLKAAGRGIQNKDKSTFSDVYTEAGWKPKSGLGKAAKAAVSLGSDVVFDPTTYVTGGTGSVAVRQAEKAGRKAEKKAAKSGLDADQAAKMGDRARTQAERKGDQTKGVTVKVAGKEIPGVRKATAKASKPARAAARKVVPKRVRTAVRNAAADVNPNATPVGASRETSRKAVRATRTARARVTQGEREAVNLAHGIRHVIGGDNYARIVDAIETQKIGSLPPELRGHAVTLRSKLKHVRRVQRRAGIKVGEIKHRPQIKVPEVTADSVTSAKALGKARRAEARAQRELDSARSAADVHQGRAEVLSRNVGGARSERAAERGRSKRKSKLAPKYAGGGYGVQRAATAAQDAAQRLKNTTKARTAAEESHAQNVATAAEQRAARARAEKVNAKRDTGVKGYVPHSLTPEAKEALDKAPVVVGKRSTKPASSKARKRKGTLAELQAKHPGEYRTDLHAVVAERMAEGTASAAQAGLNRELADAGRTLKRGQEPKLGEGEAVYHIKAGNAPREVTDKAEVARAVTPLRVNKAGTKIKGATPKSVGAGRYVVLPRKVVEQANEGIAPKLGWSNKGIVRGYDRGQSGFKRVALATPGYHVRNLVGDTQNAYLHQPGQKLPGNMVRAGRVLKAVGRDEKAQRKLGQADTGKGHLKTKRYGNVTYEEAAHQLIAAGAARSGYTSRELRELSGSGRDGLKLPKVEAPGAVKRAFLNREDLPRLATAIHAVRQGATWEEAAEKVAGAHFDYGHLTPFERNVARRLAPFYTFTARNIPLQAKRLVTNPGKYATFQKAREEAAKASQPGEVDPKTRDMYKQLEAAGVNMRGGWERYLSEFEQRNAGIPISWKGKKLTVSAGFPLTDLNELPGFAGARQAREWFDKVGSMGTPLLKDPAELGLNYSFFFRDQIERDNSPLVNAPNFVGGWPESVKKKLGVVKGQDKRSGKNVWKWPGKVDYVAHTPPGLVNQALKHATPGADRQNRGPAEKTLGAFGIRATPIDPTSNAVNLAYARMNEIDKRQASLRQQKNPANGQLISAKNPTPEYVKLAAQRKITLQIAYQGKDERGDAVLPTQGGPAKGRSSSGRVKIPGASGRVRIPGAGGRVKVP